MVSGAVRWAHPSRTGSGPQLALALRFCPSLACALASAQSPSPPPSLSSLWHRAPVWLAPAHPPPHPNGVLSRHLPHATAPSLSRPALCLSRQTPGSAPPPRHHPPGARAIPHTSCPGLPCPALAFTRAGLPLAPQTQPYPHAHPYLPQIRPSLSHVPGTASPPRPCFCRGPAPVACRSFGQVPERPTPPLPAGRPCRRPDQAPRGLPPSSLLPAAPSPGDRPARVPDPRGAPTSHGPKHLPPILAPMHSDAHSPGRGLEETSFGDGKHTSGHRGSFPTGDWPLCHRTRVSRPRRTLVPFLCRPRPLPLRRTQSLNRREPLWG